MYYKIIFTINNSIHNIKVTGDNIILLNNSEIDLINLKKKDDKVNIFTSIDEITNFNINIEDVSELAEDIDDLLTQLLILNGGSKKKVNGNIQKGGKGKFKAIKKYLDEIVKSIQNLENKQDLEKINKSLEKLHHLLTPVENPKLNEVIDSLKELIKKIENKYNEIQLLYTFLELLFKIINDEKQNNDKYDLEILFRFLKDNTFNMILPTTNNNLDLSKFLKLTKPPNLSAYKRFNKLKLIETYYKIEFENKKALNELISIEFGNRIQDELNELLMTFNQDINLTNFLSYTSKTSKNIKLLAESIIELNLIIDTEEIIQKRIVLELICSFTQLVNLTIKSSGSFILQELPPNIGRLLKLKNLKINCLDGSNFIDKSFNSAEILKSVRLPKSLIELSEIKEVEIKILSDFTKDINGDENKLLIELKENLSTASQSNEIIEGLKTQILDYFKDNPLDNLLYDGNYSFLGLDLSKLNTFSDEQKKNLF